MSFSASCDECRNKHFCFRQQTWNGETLPKSDVRVHCLQLGGANFYSTTDCHIGSQPCEVAHPRFGTFIFAAPLVGVFHRHWLLQSDSDCLVQLTTLSASLVQPNLPRIDPNAHFRVFAQGKAELPITALLLPLAMLMTLSTLLMQPNLARN